MVWVGAGDALQRREDDEKYGRSMKKMPTARAEAIGKVEC